MNIRRNHLMMELGEAHLRLVQAERKQQLTGATEDIVARLKESIELNDKVNYVLRELKALVSLTILLSAVGCASPSYSEYRSERRMEARRLAATPDGMAQGLDLLDTYYWQYWKEHKVAGTVDAGGKVLGGAAVLAVGNWAWDEWGPSQNNGNTVTTTYNGDYVGGDKTVVVTTSTETTTEAAK